MKPGAILAGIGALVAGAIAYLGSASHAQDEPHAVPQWAAHLATPAPPANAPQQAQQGYYLALAGDCTSCHSREGHEPFAGGVALTTNFGVIYGANLTPDRENGVGAWTSDQFYRALHTGIRADGAHLYPAFPYTSFTHVTRADSDAIFAYLQTLAPVHYKPPPNQLPPPLNIRAVMTIWNAFFFRAREFQPDPHQSAQWNRGAYLVTGLAHCDGCHTPRNLLGAEKNNRPLQGGRLENWHAANLGANLGAGLGSWSDQDIVDYLRTGRNLHAAASGMMGQVVVNSTSHMTDADRRAIAIYLRSLTPTQQTSAAPANLDLALGARIYANNCSACHGPDADGVANMFPRLTGDSSLQARDPSTITRLVLEGTRAPMTDANPTPSAMPAFGWKLSDAEIAAVLSYLRASHGNNAPPVRASDVSHTRRAIEHAP